VYRQRIVVPGLPPAFDGVRAAVLTDLHHGPWTGLPYIRAAIRVAGELNADLILLGGDYSHCSSQYIDPCVEALAELRAPLGMYAVLGNHDYYNNVAMTRAALERNKIELLLNSGVWLERHGQRLWLGGVDDYACGVPELEPALQGLKPNEPALLLSHNPDFVEEIKDPRVALTICGHTHGGQVVFPIVGAPIVPSRYGQKYLRGLIKADDHLVYVSRGVGTITPPVRFMDPPEVTLLEFARSA
jgi:predicted MPP superfamily phosphohydrolase